MAKAKVGDVEIVYEVVGDKGPVLALMPGARRGSAEMKPLGELIAAEGFRVLLHDRRGTGASSMVFDDTATEESIWADDLYKLLGQLNMLPAYISGSSSGARTAVMYALRHPEALSGLLIMRVSGGPIATERLPHNYYQVFIDLAEKGGMQAVADSQRFRDYAATYPKAREELLAMDVKRFIEIQKNLLRRFNEYAGERVMGATPEMLATIKVPTLVIPGNDHTHSSVSGLAANELIKGSELHQLPITDQDVELIAWEDWKPHEAEIARVFVDFMRRAEKARG